MPALVQLDVHGTVVIMCVHGTVLRDQVAGKSFLLSSDAWRQVLSSADSQCQGACAVLPVTCFVVAIHK
jgi:hypothetical protein